MPLILRAIITGFGYKLGAEIARYAATRIGLIEKPQAQEEEAQEDGIPIDPDELEAGRRRGDDEPAN